MLACVLGQSFFLFCQYFGSMIESSTTYRTQLRIYYMNAFEDHRLNEVVGVPQTAYYVPERPTRERGCIDSGLVACGRQPSAQGLRENERSSEVRLVSLSLVKESLALQTIRRNMLT